MAETSRVEQYYGDLDEQYAKDQLASLIDTTLRYNMVDKRRNLPNPCKNPIDGDFYNNLNSYRSAVKLYCAFRNTAKNGIDTNQAEQVRHEVSAAVEEEIGERIGLEGNMQAALRIKIEQLEPGLVIIDNGEERSVDSGFIDITARDASGTIVVIELKAGTARQTAITQILSYMGDMTAEEEGGRVRGIIIASDFDARTKAAARVVTDLVLVQYGVRFMFSTVSQLKPGADAAQSASVGL